MPVLIAPRVYLHFVSIGANISSPYKSTNSRMKRFSMLKSLNDSLDNAEIAPYNMNLHK